MGIKPEVLRLMLKYVKGDVFSLSYPDMVMTNDTFEEITGHRTKRECAFNHMHSLKEPFPDTEEAFKLMGATSFKCVDIVRLRGVEEIADLNEPNHFGSFDLVIDPGTTEHCANFWQATINAANAVKDGGVIFHQIPLTMVNHGFVCPQPTFYADLYGQNGWVVEKIAVTDGETSQDMPPHSRVRVPPELALCVAARRVGVGKMKYPVQHKYKQMLGAG